MIFDNTYTEEEKKENGIYYTPDDIALFMAQKAKSIDDNQGVWLDPCCGLGILSIHLASLQEDPVHFVKNRLIINEKDPKQLKIALQNFEEKFGVTPKYFNKDFLEYDFKEDFVIMNPPYFKYKENNIYGYFLNKVCKSTKGFVSINPVSFTNGEKFKNVRKNILAFKSVNLYHFDNIPGSIFKDAKVRVSIVFAHNNKVEHKTTGLIRWKSKDRKKMIKDLDKNLSDAIFSEDIFYKTSKNTTHHISQKLTLKDFVVESSEFPIFVTNSPRYFITASSQQLDRNGQIKIYLKDIESYKNALILLNSTYLYWWWRICDSSLTLTKKTLLSLPWVELSFEDDIVNKIIDSESNHKVYKKNAKKLQENIKHPKNLIVELNSLFLEDHFIKLHD
jgi:predicted RNA methylase